MRWDGLSATPPAANLPRAGARPSRFPPALGAPHSRGCCKQRLKLLGSLGAERRALAECGGRQSAAAWLLLGYPPRRKLSLPTTVYYKIATFRFIVDCLFPRNCHADACLAAGYEPTTSEVSCTTRTYARSRAHGRRNKPTMWLVSGLCIVCRGRACPLQEGAPRRTSAGR